MALRTSAKFEFGPEFTRVLVNNPDGSYPTSANVLSAVGPFDFSAASVIAAVPIKIKIDNGAVVNETLDLSAAAVPAAVTAAEFIAAYNLAVVGPGPVSGTTASIVSGRVKIAKTVPGGTYMQIYGEGAELAGFGYGYGAKIIKIDSQQSVAEAPTQKESERIVITDSNGQDTSVITDAYRTGSNLTLVDSAFDQELREVIEGGSYNETTLVYSAPISTAVKPTFSVETFSPTYAKDENHKSNMSGYIERQYHSCKGTGVGERAGDRNFQGRTYNIAVTPYRDPSTLVLSADVTESELTVAAYEALDVLNV